MPKKELLRITIKRPSWESVRKAYDKINTANPNDKNLQEIFKEAIIEKGKWYGFSQKKAEQIAQEIIEQIINKTYDDFVWQRYALVGGIPLSEYISYKDFFGKSPEYENYGNTCALQVSYALNYGGMPLHTEIKVREYNAMYGRDRKCLYILGADYMGRYLNDKWGKAELSVTATDNDKPMILEQIRDRNGIVVMKGDYSHATLWSGKDFVDVENRIARNYYLTDMGTAKLEFWELK